MHVILSLLYLQAMGEIVSTGEGSKLSVGQNVAFSKYGSFSEYVVGYLVEKTFMKGLLTN